MALGPIRTESSKLGQIGEQIVQAKLSAFAVCNHMHHDFGFDLLCQLVEGGRVECIPAAGAQPQLRRERKRVSQRAGGVDHRRVPAGYAVGDRLLMLHQHSPQGWLAVTDQPIVPHKALRPSRISRVCGDAIR